jgi:acetyl esterase
VGQVRLGWRDRLDGLVARVAGSLPVAVQRGLGGHGVVVDAARPHPEVQLMLRLMALAPRPSFETLPVEEARVWVARQARVFGGRPIPVPDVRDVAIPAPYGVLPARLYRTHTDGRPGGLLVYFHGGGWVVGDLDSADNVCRYLASNAGVSVLSVDYRLAPEHPFPAAVEDALTAFDFASAHAPSLGARPDAIAVGGDSAGGNLAAVVCQLRTAGERPAFQLLFYPATDLSRKHDSVRRFARGYFLTEAQLDWYREHYLADPVDALDPRASPLLAEDLTGLPRAYIATAGFDPLRDEGERYGQRLRGAGVPVVVRRHEQLIHAFVNATGVGRTGRAALGEAATALRDGLSATDRC